MSLSIISDWAIRNFAAFTAPLLIFENVRGMETPAVVERAGGRKPFQSLS